MNRKSAMAGLAAATLLAVSLPASASAGVLFREKYTWADSYSFDDCGFQVDVDAQGGGLYILRDATPATGGQFFRLTDNYSYVERLTNPENGRWVERTANGTFIELPPSEVSEDGRVFTFRSVEAGQPFVLRDSEGTVLMRDRGALVAEYTFDSLGDSEPGGVLIGEPELVKVAGPHPGLFAGCEELEGWIG